jgi:two-component system, OmpR family, KDP operon response regulator KdpE
MNKSSNVALLIDDEPKIRRFLRAGFELHGFSVLEAESGADGLKAATFGPPDLIILDLALPDLHGAEVLERLRSWSNVPVIILSVVANENEKVRLLQAGADDYVVKPFGMGELLARSDAALRRYFKSATENPVVVAGPLAVDLVGRTVSLNDNQIRLTRKEYRLLHILATHVGFVVTHDQLLEERQSERSYPVPANSRSQAATEDRNRSQSPAPSRDRVGCRLSPAGPPRGCLNGLDMLRPSPRRSFYVVVSRTGSG